MSISNLRKLASQDDDRRCLSIYLPTERAGREVRQNPIRMKNLLREAESRLTTHSEGESGRAILTRLEDLHGDTEFWEKQSEGLAILASADGLEVARLPYRVPELVYVGRRFCVRPLVPALCDDSRFYVLALSQQHVRLLDCTRDRASEVELHDVPGRIEDVVGYDWEEKTLQHHSGSRASHPNGAAAIFHGQGRPDADHRDEIKRFCVAVDRGVRATMEEPSAPVVLACVDFVEAIYRSESELETLADESITGNPDTTPTEVLHERGRDKVESSADKRTAAELEKFGEGRAAGLTTAGLEETLDALMLGLVGTLFIDPSVDVWGRVDTGHPDTRSGVRVVVHNEREKGDEDLVDLLVARAIATGAELRTVDREQLDGAACAGLLRAPLPTLA